ncbi:MAG: transposase [Candidatus Pacebacteria bacterium]|nr:transposase [Candidatus Paceibacterota bacterium]
MHTIFNLVQNKKENREEISSRILKTVFEALLEVERDEFMKNKESQNKKNGYYSRLAKTLAGIFEIKVPRDRLGLFKSLILEIAKREKQNLDQLAFELYSKGMSDRDIGSALENVYG